MGRQESHCFEHFGGETFTFKTGAELIRYILECLDKLLLFCCFLAASTIIPKLRVILSIL